jgi:hypothetical protein
MRRRLWLAAAVSAALAFPAQQARAAGPELPPLSVDGALDQIETLIAPEALAAFYAAPEDAAETSVRLVVSYRLGAGPR